MDCANINKVVAMGQQIYEASQNNVMTDVSIMEPNSIKLYKVEGLAGWEHWQAVFENLDREAALVMISTTTPHDRLRITFKFNSDRIRTIEQLHALLIPGRISEGRQIVARLDAIFRETSLPGSQDGFGRSTHCSKTQCHLQGDLKNWASRRFGKIRYAGQGGQGRQGPHLG